MHVALYARVSTTKQVDKDLSMPDQLKQMRSWCKANGHLIANEYIEAGATATDDKRPAFQQMIADATTMPLPYQAIIVHSRSRFFRDLSACLYYEKKLKRSGCRVISITQQTSDDPTGEMASTIFSLFDEYSSKENAKHTLRAMQENARNGYLNGSTPCFGYMAVECFMDEAQTKKKKRAEIHPDEAAIVRDIFNFYLNGINGSALGLIQIATHLNEKCLTRRGTAWNKSRVHEILSNPAYIGEYYFNKHNQKTKTLKPESEWIKLKIEPIIDDATFEAVRVLRESRAPAKRAPRIVNSPVLLTGLLKCGLCGAGLTTATGKSGKYRYYKCNTRINKAKHLCDAPSLPMDKFDKTVMDAMLNQILVPERMSIMMKELLSRQKALLSKDDKVKPLQHELDQLNVNRTRLYEAVEQGKIPLDDFLQQRAQKLKTRQEEITLEMAALNRQRCMPIEMINPNKLETFSKAIRKILLDRISTTGKDYLRLLVDEIRITGGQAVISGNTAVLASVVLEAKVGTVVPTFVPNWLPDLDSNQGPAD